MHQLVLELPHRPAFGREDFLITPANEAAVAVVDAWPDWHSPMAALVGPRGSGKTHLSEVWRKNSNARRENLNELSLEDLPKALASGALVLENVPWLAVPEELLFHLFNLAKQQGAYVLLSCEKSPLHWPVNLADLRSRLQLVAIGELQLPDNELLQALLVKQFSDRQIEIDQSVIDYLIKRIVRSGAAVTDIVARLDAAALAAKSAMTRRFVAHQLSELMDKTGEAGENEG